MRIPQRFDRLSVKLVLAVGAFMLLLLVTVVTAVNLGLGRLQANSAQLSAGALTQQSRQDLQERAMLEANISNARLAKAANLTRIAADYFVAAAANAEQTAWDDSQFQTYPQDNLLYDANPQRLTDLVIPGYVTMDEAQWQRLAQSAVLDNIFPSLLAQAPEAIAIYYQETSMVFRYFPVINVVQYLAGSPGLDPANRNYLREQSPVAPVNDPERLTVWDPPYADNLGQGLLITANTPVYFQDEFQGVISIDLSLERLVAQLQEIQPTPGSYAFIVDENGRLVASAANGIPHLLDQSGSAANQQLADILGVSLVDSSDANLATAVQTMLADNAGLIETTVGGDAVFLAYAPLPDLHWTLGIVTPLAELTAPAAGLAAETAVSAAGISRLTLGVVVFFFLAALVGVVVTNRRLTRPIASLVRGTEDVTAGNLDVTIPVTTHDELGRLAGSFNSMTAVLRQNNDALQQQNEALKKEIADRLQAEAALRDSEEQHRRALEQRVAERTRELTTLLDVSHNLTLTLELPALFRLILEQLHSVVAFESASIFTLEREELALVFYQGPLDPSALPSRWDWRQSPPNRQVIETAVPLLIPDLRADTPPAQSWRTISATQFGGALDAIQSWLGVPLLIKNRVIGMLTLDHTQANFFAPRHADLTLAFANQTAVAIENTRLYEQAQSLAALEERQKLARELHDSVSQALYGIALGTRTARTLVARAGDEQPLKQALGEPLDYILSLAEAGLAEMRALIFELRPESLATEGLVAALNKQSDSLRARHNLAVHTDFCPEPDVPLPAKEALYRVSQEALHNIVKHAQAHTVRLTLECQPDRLSLTIADDGHGFDASGEFPGHLGLHSMRERIERVGGVFVLSSAPAKGTHITVEIPRS